MTACRHGHDPRAASRYQTGELTGGDRDAFERHLTACAACRGAVAAQRRLDELLVRLPTYRATLAADPFLQAAGSNPSPEGARSVERPLPSPHAAEHEPQRRRRPVRRAIAASALAAGLLLVIGIGLRERRLQGLVREAVAADTRLLVGAPAAGDIPGRTVPPWLGFSPCGSDIAPPGEGLYVCALFRGTPLQRVGVRAGDRLLSLDGERITTSESMHALLARREIGDSVTLEVRTSGRLLRRRIPLVARPPFAMRAMEMSPALRWRAENLLPNELAIDSVFRFPRSAEGEAGAPGGALVRRAFTHDEWSRTRLLGDFAYPFGPDGLRAGDVVLAIDGRAIHTWADLAEAYSRTGTGPVALTVRRAGAHRRITIAPADAP